MGEGSDATWPSEAGRVVDFQREVEKLLAQVPAGRVTTFGALATALGDTRAAVPVSRLLRRHRPAGWHRVVKADGSLTIEGAAPRLQSEGIGVREGLVLDFRGVLFDSFSTERPLVSLRREQRRLARKVVTEDRFGELRSVAGIDVSYRGSQAHAAAVLLDWRTLGVREEVGLTTAVDFPYISTYLAYREFPPVARCYARFGEPPSLLLVDGNGTLHPERFGIACYVGLKLDRPTIGVAKSLLLGHPDRDLLEIGESSPVRVNGDVAGYALRAVAGKPIYVSPGHRVNGETALQLVERLCRTRIPQPLHLADRAARRMRQGKGG